MFVGTGAGGESRKLPKKSSRQKTTEGMEDSSTGDEGKRGNETHYQVTQHTAQSYCTPIHNGSLYTCGIDILNFSGDFCFKLLLTNINYIVGGILYYILRLHNKTKVNQLFNLLCVIYP